MLMPFTQLKQALDGIPLLEQEPLSKHLTFQVGGPVTLMALPETPEQCSRCLSAAHALGVTPLLLGRGSNVLAPDEGLERFVIKLGRGLDEISCSGTTLTAGSGASLRAVAQRALQESLNGLAFAHGIPGTLGGGIVMNAGAYGGEMRDVVVKTHALRMDGSAVTFVGDAHDFSYRHSVFSSGAYIILSAQLRLQPGDATEIKKEMDTLLQKRRSSQPLELPSAGSTFKRPALGYASALIEQCGLKGVSVGGAQVSTKHSGFIVNTGGASCADILALMKLVQQRVHEQTGITLEPEVRLWKN